MADSLGLKEFLGYSITNATPDHSTIGRNRRLLDVETHDEIFVEQVLGEVVADKGYHSDKVLTRERGRDIRTYISEPNRPKRK